MYCELHGNKVNEIDSIPGVGSDTIYRGEFLAMFDDIYETDSPLWDEKERKMPEGTSVIDAYVLNKDGSITGQLVVYAPKAEHMHGQGWGTCTSCGELKHDRDGTICSECWESMEPSPPGWPSQYDPYEDDEEIPF